MEDVTLVKYPRTKHISWSKGVSDDDKIIKDLSNFQGKRVILTEKLDGECTTCRSRYDKYGVHARSVDSPMTWWREWVRSVQINIADQIQGVRVCGENMFATHSIEYDNLISYFYIFSIWDEETNVCLSWDETVEYAELLDLPTPKVLYDGIWDEDLFRKMYEEMDTEKMEGFTIRLADSFHYDDFGDSLIKAVREGHVQTDTHWSETAVQAKLAEGVEHKPSFMFKDND